MADETTVSRLGYICAEGAIIPDSGHWIEVHNPATGEVLAEAYETTPAVMDTVVEQAHIAFTSIWRSTRPDERGKLLRDWASVIANRRDELATIEVADVGNLRSEVLGDIDSCVRILRYYAGMADKIEGTVYAQIPGRLAYGLDEPFGVVAGINPYNANANFVVMKSAPALIAGNCIVLKAPEIAPLLTYRLVELALEAGIPPGVISVVTGRGEVVGPLLSEHSGIGMVAFTGSPGAGKSVITSSARNIVPVILELGGKSPAVLLPDADLTIAIPSVLHSNFVKSGQSCVAGSRILVHHSKYEQVCDELAREAKAVKVGLPSLASSQMGTLISQPHRDRVHGLVQRALASGATCLVGGMPAEEGDLAAGAFYQPTVLADVADDNPAATTEAFGPMASVLSYGDIDEALARANATSFGLSSQVWGNDAASIQYLTQNLEAGTVWVNTYRAFHPSVPFGGAKQSGFGLENGIASVAMYTRRKSVVWDLSTQRELPYTE
ncbi:MAG: aldehyde dehydrogenase family protein [Hyphomicrobiales bacterium]|nr:MAG: aldehyde dehydrogenase family protein [Hyphomicrobiales bacterium]